MHAHSHDLWAASLGRIPTTSETVAYGTPAMAEELARLIQESDFPTKGIAAMGGHEDGLIAVGPDLETATRRMLDFAKALNA